MLDGGTEEGEAEDRCTKAPPAPRPLFPLLVLFPYLLVLLVLVLLWILGVGASIGRRYKELSR